MPTNHGPEFSSDAPQFHPNVARLPQGALAEVPTVRAVEFIRKMRGASQPFLLRADNSEYYVVKFLNNPQHRRILANEMFAARLALLLGLPSPEPAFVDVSGEFVAGNPQMRIETGRRDDPCAAGLQFGSGFAGVPGRTLVVDFLPERMLSRVANLAPAFLGGLVFDKWTCNCDGRQVLFTRSLDEEGGAYSAWLIDHGFCFNDGEWNFPDSPIRGIYPRRVVYRGVRGLDSFEPFLSRAEQGEPAQLEQCAKGIPEEWCGDGAEKLLELAERLYARRKRLRQAIIDAKNSSMHPFPDWA